MIQLTKGNLLQADVEALVNTVNNVGVMGKGIALQFKEKFDENYKLYKKAAEEKKIKTGEVFIVATNRIDKIKWIINFPTKKHWRNPSKLEYIETGLNDLVKKIEELNIKSIAMPPLGCGNGGLEWNVVKEIIEEKFKGLPNVNVVLYEPSNIAYDEVSEKSKVKPRLTPTRALILYLMKSYAQFDYSLTVLETQKLVYFLSRLGEGELTKIQFQKHHYGPYAAILNHVLYDIDGFYISGMKYKDVKTFDYLEVLDKNYCEVEAYIKTHSTNTQRERIEILLALIEGFETPLSMELLSTVDFVINNEVADKECLPAIVEKVQSWNERKRQLMSEEFITLAFNRLREFKDSLYN
ncbi:MAG: O-acetyl-ADP-ribose deacetylase [Segetibacter sp.]|nr:O-acetyl-ADP-ribose deacetylase [Segetibacter sp.]